MAKTDATQVVGREQLAEVRIQQGAVHWGGARVVTHITTIPDGRSASGQHVLIADELRLHPAGVQVRVDQEEYVIPYARVEVCKFA